MRYRLVVLSGEALTGRAHYKLTPFGCRLLVNQIKVGSWSVATAAGAAGVSRQTAHEWLADGRLKA